MTWSQWPWLSTITSMSSGEIPSRRMFSTIPFGDTPVSNNSVRSRPPCSMRTSAEKPGSAIERVGHAAVRAHARRGAGKRAVRALGQFSRATAS